MLRPDFVDRGENFRVDPLTGQGSEFLFSCLVTKLKCWHSDIATIFEATSKIKQEFLGTQSKEEF